MTYVTDAMRQAGSDIASALMNGSIAKSMDGLGGSKPWSEFVGDDAPNKDLVLAYLSGEIDSMTAIYVAMERAK